MAKWILIGVIVAYCFFIIRRKVRDIKAGKYCSCSCGGDCSACHQKK